MNQIIDSEPKSNGCLRHPQKDGDIIACGVYEGTNGLNICWVDFVVDELLYAISKGAKGWSTLRTEPAPMSDEQKQAQLNNLQGIVYENLRRKSEGG